jgi:hypothetical protein
VSLPAPEPQVQVRAAVRAAKQSPEREGDCFGGSTPLRSDTSLYVCIGATLMVLEFRRLPIN